MTTRREFLQGLAVSTLPLVNVGSVRSGEVGGLFGGDTTTRIYRFLVDARFPESVSAGRAAALQGLTLQTMADGDITDFWFNDLSRCWRQAPVVVAGMTGHGALFVLERFAWDHGMRVVARVEHCRHADTGSMMHSVFGPDEWVVRMERLPSSGDWISAMPAALTQCSVGPHGQSSREVPSGSRSTERAEVEPLFSWLIGPGNGLSKVTDRL